MNFLVKTFLSWKMHTKLWFLHEIYLSALAKIKIEWKKLLLFFFIISKRHFSMLCWFSMQLIVHHLQCFHCYSFLPVFLSGIQMWRDYPVCCFVLWALLGVGSSIPPGTTGSMYYIQRRGGQCVLLNLILSFPLP